jgi:hypothetical protein
VGPIEVVTGMVILPIAGLAAVFVVATTLSPGSVKLPFWLKSIHTLTRSPVKKLDILTVMSCVLPWITVVDMAVKFSYPLCELEELSIEAYRTLDIFSSITSVAPPAQ